MPAWDFPILNQERLKNKFLLPFLSSPTSLFFVLPFPLLSLLLSARPGRAAHG